MRAVIFSGQGTQYPGMGKDLPEDIQEKVFKEAGEILSFDLYSLCLNGPEEELDKTEKAQPTILTVSYGWWLNHLRDSERQEKPDLVAGHSLGEYTALIAAEVISFETALSLVQKRGQLMAEAGEQFPGGMMVVRGNLQKSRIERISKENGVWIANLNSPREIVISGEKESLLTASFRLREEGYRLFPLPISVACHSPLMKSAQKGLRQVLKAKEFREPQIPVIFNASGDYEMKPGGIKKLLVRQMTSRVLWQKTIQKMSEKGVWEFVEIGPRPILYRSVEETIRRVEGGKFFFPITRYWFNLPAKPNSPG